MKVLVLLGNNYPKDMKLIQFMLRANRIDYQLFDNNEACLGFFEAHTEPHANGSIQYLLLTDTSDKEFLIHLSETFPFCYNGIMIGDQLEAIFSDEIFFNAIHCFVARNESNAIYYPNQVMGAVYRILNHDLFGLRHFLYGSYSSYAKEISSTQESQDITYEISDYVFGICQNTSVATRVEGICDELTLNALYDANPRYDAQKRNFTIEPNEAEKIQIKYGCDGRLFAISVADGFGRLGKETIYKYLNRSLFDSHPLSSDVDGAGLGFFRILNAVNTLVVNVIPEKKTEVIGICDISLSRRALREAKKSFYYLNT